MGKSKRMKKWGGANDPNAVPPGNYGDPNASTTVSPVPTPVAAVEEPEPVQETAQETVEEVKPKKKIVRKKTDA